MALISWKGGAGGNGDWQTAKDWAGGVVPGPNDIVLFAIGAAYTVTGNDSVATLGVLGDTVTFDGMVSVSGTFGLNAGSYVTLDQNALFNVGTFSVGQGALAEVQGLLLDTGAIDLGAVLVDGGGAQWLNSGTAEVNQLQVFDGGTVAGDIQLDNFGAIKLDPTAQFGGSTLTLAGNGSLYMAQNAGAQALGIAETINFSQAGTGLFLGSDPGTELNLSGPIGGAGYVLVNAGTVELSGTANTYSGGTVVDGATLIVDGAGSAGTDAIYLANNAALIDNAAQNGRTIVASSGDDTISGGGGGMVVWATAGTTLNFTGGATGSEVIGNLSVIAAGTLNVTGGPGHDTIYAYNEGAVNFQGGTGGALVYGGSGVLHAVGGSGGDTIFAGTSGRDVLQTGTGPTTLAGGTAGALLIATGSAANLLAAGGGNTTLNGSTATGNNVYFGASSGSTTIEGGSGNDTIVGTGGADTVYGGHGTENVFAGNGSLQLDFVTTFGGGSTYVQGFNVASDHIHLSGFAPDAVQQALASEQVIGGNTVLTLSDNTTLVFWNTTGITASNFN